MKLFNTRKEINNYLISLRNEGQKIGFVPTMGALHNGHISLVKQSVAQNHTTVVSIFVNPTQFNNKQDLEKYPRNLEADIELLSNSGCEVIFAPNENEMYPEPDTRIFDFGILDKVMEGKHRPGHFNGVGQIVSKLFEAVPAHSAYFGLKDFQQLAVINQLVHQLSIPITIVPCAIVREANGLAMSSRNELLTSQQRNEAQIIYQTLLEIKNRWGTLQIDELEQLAMDKINSNAIFKVEYFEIVNNKTLEKASLNNKPSQITACTAVFARNVRLIDNIQF
jgi:pantoate--beta-alanine ligase